MKSILLSLFVFFSSFSLFSQVWDFQCSNSNESITVNITDVDNDGVIDGNCDYLYAYILACSDNDEFMEFIYPSFLEDLVGTGCSDFDPNWEIEIIGDSTDDNNGGDDNIDDDNWSSVFISLNADSLEINEIGFEIYDCAGNLYLSAGAPYEGYTEVPNDFTIVMIDMLGDGWNEGSVLYIDGYGYSSLESGYTDTISNCDSSDDSDNNGDDDSDNNGDDDFDNVLNCEEGTYISVNGGVWQDEVSWTITDCDGVILANNGAPYEDCVILPENYVIIMNDSWGDGWNGNYMTIGNDMYTLEYGSENVMAIGDCDIDWWSGNDSVSDWDENWNMGSDVTFECNGEIVNVSFSEFGNNLNAWSDWNLDGVIDDRDFEVYLLQTYDCDESEINIVFDIWDDIIWNDSNWDLDTLNWDDDFDWDMNNDGSDDFTWDDFDWENIWNDYMFSDIDWENAPWGDIIDLGINPEDLINFLIELGDGRISAFDWRDFIDYYNNTLPLDLENSILNDKYVIQSINILGQNVDRDLKGIVFELYNDGSVKRKYILK